jgi:hypothetical protein
MVAPVTAAVIPTSHRDAMVIARAHLRSAKALRGRAGMEREVNHHVDEAHAVLDRALRSEDDTRETPQP